MPPEGYHQGPKRLKEEPAHTGPGLRSWAQGQGFHGREPVEAARNSKGGNDSGNRKQWPWRRNLHERRSKAALGLREGGDTGSYTKGPAAKQPQAAKKQMEVSKVGLRVPPETLPPGESVRDPEKEST
jgi:hypothetical protein